jgi:hypothetical protein
LQPIDAGDINMIEALEQDLVGGVFIISSVVPFTKV